jgi:hypothetical protein
VDVYGARGGALTAIGASVRSEAHPGGAGQAVTLRIDEGPGAWGDARLVAPLR